MISTATGWFVRLGVQTAVAILAATLLGGCANQVPTVSPHAPAKSGITLFLIGDSTMADKPLFPPNPERGWGQLLPLYFQSDVRIENHAVNGRSSKSFLDEGRWQAVLAQLQPGDYVIIQFGHNDEKKNDPKRYTEPFGGFKQNLELFIRQTREHQATPILATPVARRKFDAAGTLVDTHGDYVPAVRLVAQQEHTPLLDLNHDSAELLTCLGPEASKRLYDWIPAGEFARYPKGLSDDTHFNAYGASRMCDLAAGEIKLQVPELARHLKENADPDANQGGLEK
jgi:lysophospholipase L1-like esterase